MSYHTGLVGHSCRVHTFVVRGRWLMHHQVMEIAFEQSRTDTGFCIGSLLYSYWSRYIIRSLREGHNDDSGVFFPLLTVNTWWTCMSFIPLVFCYLVHATKASRSLSMTMRLRMGSKKSTIEANWRRTYSASVSKQNKRSSNRSRALSILNLITPNKSATWSRLNQLLPIITSFEPYLNAHLYSTRLAIVRVSRL